MGARGVVSCSTASVPGVAEYRAGRCPWHPGGREVGLGVGPVADRPAGMPR
ncbi:hypothetical protein STTU_0318 [Streptomyces sp. Tu6071]|nr:hypothetical protein STTU_0318 [Streptomyces sp. Tu6071]